MPAVVPVTRDPLVTAWAALQAKFTGDGVAFSTIVIWILSIISRETLVLLEEGPMAKRNCVPAVPLLTTTVPLHP